MVQPAGATPRLVGERHLAPSQKKVLSCAWLYSCNLTAILFVSNTGSLLWMPQLLYMWHQSPTAQACAVVRVHGERTAGYCFIMHVLCAYECPCFS